MGRDNNLKALYHTLHVLHIGCQVFCHRRKNIKGGGNCGNLGKMCFCTVRDLACGPKDLKSIPVVFTPENTRWHGIGEYTLNLDLIMYWVCFFPSVGNIISVEKEFRVFVLLYRCRVCIYYHMLYKTNELKNTMSRKKWTALSVRCLAKATIDHTSLWWFNTNSYCN